MATLLTMPSLSPTMETGVIATWLKKVGDHIEVGDVLAEIETDKAVMEYEMPDEGYLRELLVETGQELQVGTPIAILADSMDEDISAVKAQAASGQAAAPAAAPAQSAAESATAAAAVAPAAQAAPVPQPPPAAPAAPAAVQPAAQPAPAPSNGHGNGARVRVSPYARKLAEEAQLDLAALQGSGPGGRIVARDVESAIEHGGAIAPAAPGVGVPLALPVAGGPAYEDLPISQMRKAIARKMTEAKTTVPHFQLTRKIRAEALLDGREALKAQFPDLRITVNDILVKACAAALRAHPTVNSQFLGDKVRRFHTVDIAVAVGTEEGLITPVLRNVEVKGLAQISAEMKALGEKARNKKLAPEDYTGGTFTLSNLGMYGVTEFNAIINTPQACILAVSGVVTEPVVENGQLAVGRTLNMTLSSDHRVVDGVIAARFMDTLARMLENPLAMLL